MRMKQQSVIVDKIIGLAPLAFMVLSTALAMYTRSLHMFLSSILPGFLKSGAFTDYGDWYVIHIGLLPTCILGLHVVSTNFPVCNQS